MKWFQHQSKAHTDAKLQKVLMKYGFEGYGLYWYCIESICGNLEPKLTFELEQDSEILAHIGKMDSRIVEEAMKYMVFIGLFSESDGAIFCRKIARYLGDNLTRNDQLRSIIKHEKGTLSATVSDSLRLSVLEERRGEENKKICTRKEPNPLWDQFWNAYPNKKTKAKAEHKFNRLSPNDQQLALEDTIARAKSDPDWIKENGKYVPLPTTYLNGSRWEDEWKPVSMTKGFDYV